MTASPLLPRALLDANVLWSPVLRDTLLRVAEHPFYQPLWSQEILKEMVRTILAKRVNTRPENLAQTITNMQRAFPDATVSGYTSLIPQLTNHPGDRHVLAAAIHGRAEQIVTWNRRHFLPAATEIHGMAVVTPDTFLCQLWTHHSESIGEILIQQGADLRPPLPVTTIVESLRRSGVTRFVRLASESLGAI
jgi:predicted nucleic acid-binding protein